MMIFCTLLLSSISASAASVYDAVDVNMTMTEKKKKPSKNGFPLLPAGVSIFNIDSAGGHGPPLQIVNGTETEGPVDYMVALGSGAKGRTSNAPYCGGSLIAPRIVLTAAHCMSSRQVDLYRVIVNMHDITNTSGVESILLNRGVRGEDIIVHHSYDDDTLENDVALMILPNEVPDITYARINEDTNVPGQAGDRLRVIGWGTTSSGGELSDILLEAEVEYQMNEQCNDAYSEDGEDVITDGMMCAASDGIDTCQGDSGGPMMLASDEGDPVQVGIVSWGYGCAHPDYPGVYTRVSYYADWIKETACAFTGDFCPTCQASQKLMKVIIHTDAWPGETTWKVTNKCGSSSDPIMSGGPYSSRFATQVTVDCVPEGEYEFTIEDFYGDGNCCNEGYGYYSFKYGDEEAIGGDFGFSATESLGSCTSSSPTSQPTHTPTHQVTSAPQPPPTNVTGSPTAGPTQVTPPTNAPTPQPTHPPTHQVTSAPQPLPTNETGSPTAGPTQVTPPTNAPTPQPTHPPTHQVTSAPQPPPTNVTGSPTAWPTQVTPPTNAPTRQPTHPPTHQVTSAPQPQPTNVTESPTAGPTVVSTSTTLQPTQVTPPTKAPTPTSTNAPTSSQNLRH